MSSNFFRVSTANMYDSTLRNLAARQKTLVDLQENLTSGKRVVRPSDDPVAAAQAERALTRIGRIQAEQRQLENRRNTIAQGEAALADVVELVQEIRQNVIAAGNGSLTAAERQTYALQLRSLREQLTGTINRQDTNGLPLLGALGSALTPFSGPLPSSPDYQFNGLAGQGASQGNTIAGTLDGHAALMFDPLRDGVYSARVARSGASTLTTSTLTTSNLQDLDGASYALQINSVTLDPIAATTSVDYTLTKTDRLGNVSSTGPITTAPVPSGTPIPITITEGGNPVLRFDLKGTPDAGDSVDIAPSASLMSVVDEAIAGIGAASDSASANHVVAQALVNLDAGLERVKHVRGYAGELLNRADRVSDEQQQRSIQLEGDRSRAEDLDMLQGISDFQNSNVGYEAALKSYAQVQRLSLFNYIG